MSNELRELQDLLEKMVKSDKPRDYYSITRMLKNYEPVGGCTFKKGDFVTPKEGTDLKNPGEPCIVLEAFSICQYHLKDSSKPLIPYNMIIARAAIYDPDEVILYVDDSSKYEIYKGVKVGDIQGF